MHKDFILVHVIALKLLVINLLSQPLNAQSYIANLRKLSLQDGLSNRFVRALHKDQQGFIWIGTEHGLNRFDGYQFKQYTTANSNLFSNVVRGIYEDDQHRLWLTQIENQQVIADIAILTPKTDGIDRFSTLFKEKAPFKGNDIEQIHGNSLLEIWIQTKDGRIYSYINQQFKLWYTIPKHSDLYLKKVDNQFIWLIESENIYVRKIIRINKNTNASNSLDFPEKTRLIDIDNKHRLWYYQLDNKVIRDTLQAIQLKRLHSDSLNLPKNLYKPNNSIKDIFNPYDNLLWWFHKDQQQAFFYVIDTQKGIVLDLQRQLEPFFSYKLPIVSSFLFSKNQAWIGTEDGIFNITYKKSKFSTLLTSSEQTNSMRGITTLSDGTLFVNTYGERLEVSPDRNKITSFPGGIWMGIYKDHHENVWFGSHENRIEKYSPSSEQRINYIRNPNDQKYLGHLCMLIDRNGRLWSGSYAGLYYKDAHSDNFKKFVFVNEFDILNRSNIYQLEEKQDGIWITASTGLYRLGTDYQNTIRYCRDCPPPYQLPFDKLLHTYHNQDQIIWMATQGGGLLKKNIKNGHCKQFTMSEGLSSNIIYAVYQDDCKQLWLPSNYGLMTFDTTTHDIQTYLKSEGISHNEFNTLSHHKAKDGKLYFGGLSGITVVDPKNFKQASYTPAPLRIISCKVLNGNTGVLRDVTKLARTNAKIHLTPSDKSLILNFALLNYENSRQNSYSYKIEGLDKNWNKLEFNNNIRINNLPYGNYNLRVKAKDIKGTASANELRIPIRIEIPIYLKTEVIIVSILLLLLILFTVFKWQVNRLKRKQVILENMVRIRTEEIQLQKDKIEEQAFRLQELDAAKSRFFANISHELRTPLTLILGPLQSLITIVNQNPDNYAKDTFKFLGMIRRNGQRLLKRVEEILDLSKLEALQMQVYESQIDFYPFCKRIFSSFESLAQSRNIYYTLLFHPDKTMSICIDVDKVEKIITNLLSNAFKHSGDHVAIRLEILDNESHVFIKVIDTGFGISPEDIPFIFDRFYQSKTPKNTAQGGTGIGLSLCKELATLMKGEIIVDSTLHSGSSFILKLPKNDPIDTSKTIKESSSTINTKLTSEQANTLLTTDKIDFKIPEPSVILNKSENTARKSTVLIVEDHIDMQQFIIDTIKDEYQIIVAFHGKQALEELKNTSQLPDIIISDVMMPVMDGFTLLNHIKSNRKWQMIPVIMLTARAAQQDKIHALQTGVNDYITKPFDPPELLARIQNLLAAYQERKAWQNKNFVKQQLKTDLEENFEKTTPTWETTWLNQATDIIKREIGNATYKVPDLANEMKISETQLLVKMKQIAGLTPKEFIKEIRLQHARMLLEGRNKRTIAEVAYAAGFNTPGYFSKVYYKHFGKQPADYFTNS